jgi:hypothetical protein
MPSPVTLGRITPTLERFEGAFLRCTDCNAVHRIARSDRAPVYLYDGTPSPADDFQRFLTDHSDHRFQLLHRANDAEMISHARWDPMCRIAWEVTDGDSSFIVTFGRIDLEHSRQYAVSPGRLNLENETIAIDAEVFHRLVDEALFPHAAPQKKIDALLDRCRRSVAAVPSERFEPIDEVRDDPNVQLACLPDSVVAELRTATLALFAPEEAERLVEVIETDLRAFIPVVRISRQYRIGTAL